MARLLTAALVPDEVGPTKREVNPDGARFGAVLMPLLAEHGIDAGEPSIMSIHKLVEFDANQ